MDCSTCCTNKKMITYSRKHNENEFPLDFKTLKNILYGFPIKTNYQVRMTTKDLLDNSVCNDYVYKIIVGMLGLNEKTDILWGVDIEKERKKLECAEQICISCQKIHIKSKNSKKKAVNLLCHLRNIVAHGEYNVVDGVFIGFDYFKFKGYTAEIKINYRNFKKISKFIAEECTITNLASIVFTDLGYKVVEQSRYEGYHDNNLVLEKNGKEYFLKFEVTKDNYLSEEYANKIIDKAESLKPADKGQRYVLVTPVSALGKSEKNRFKEKDIWVLGRNELKKLFDGTDVLQEF